MLNRTHLCSSATALYVIKGKCPFQQSRQAEKMTVSVSARPPKSAQIHHCPESCRFCLHLSHLQPSPFPSATSIFSLLLLTKSCHTCIFSKFLLFFCPLSLLPLLASLSLVLFFSMKIKISFLTWKTPHKLTTPYHPSVRFERRIHCGLSCNRLWPLLPSFFTGGPSRRCL